MVRETRLSPTSLVYPMFVCPGEGVRKEVRSMPGVFNLSVDEAVNEAQQAHSLGVPAVILFGLPEKKDELATGAWAEDGIVQQVARAMKSEVPEAVVMGDVCLCEYMSHGHCGIVRVGRPQSLGAAVAAPPAVGVDYEIVNDATLELLARTSVSLARAGVDIIAPSDMMDGRVGAIRKRARSMRALRIRQSFLMRRSLPRLFTGRFAKRLTRRHSLATAGLIKWMEPTCARPCARSNSTLKKAQT